MTLSIIVRTKRDIAEKILGQALGLLGNSSTKKTKYFIKALDHIASGERGEIVREWLHNWIEDGKLGREFLSRMLKNTHPNVRRRFIARMFVSLFFRNSMIVERCKQKYGISPPQAMVISPTMRCNFRCEGCYAASYERKDDMPPEVFDRLLTEAEEIGIKFFILVGGEPFIYPEMLPIIKRHDKAFFQIYTNGSLIDRVMCKELIKLGNVAPQISINGPAEFTDASRGNGAFEKAEAAMDNLREAGCIFGFSTLVTSLNVDAICSEEWIDYLIEKGALYGWLFLYMPVGDDPDMRLMPTPEQRNKLRIVVKQLRGTKPIIPIDFWNDGPLAGSCLAGGRHYFHINHRGDAEPCIFCHFTTHNINQHSIAEVLRSPFFTSIREGQPFSYNSLMPCPIIDHPDTMWNIIQQHGARPTHEGAEKMFTAFAQEMKEYSARVHQIMETAWDTDGYHNWAPRWAAMCVAPRKLEERYQSYVESQSSTKS